MKTAYLNTTLWKWGKKLSSNNSFFFFNLLICERKLHIQSYLSTLKCNSLEASKLSRTGNSEQIILCTTTGLLAVSSLLKLFQNSDCYQSIQRRIKEWFNRRGKAEVKIKQNGRFTYVIQCDAYHFIAVIGKWSRSSSPVL